MFRKFSRAPSAKSNGRYASLDRIASTLGAIALGLCIATPSIAAPNLVVNGGFETGDFTGWTTNGDQTFNGVSCPGKGDPTVAEGNCSAFFGPFGATAGISQVLTSLTVGGDYRISFALDPDGGLPSSFSATFGGQTLISLTDLPGSFLGPYRTYNFVRQATAASQVLAFNFREDPGFMFFDAVSVSVPEPATLMLAGLGLVGLAATRRRTFRPTQA